MRLPTIFLAGLIVLSFFQFQHCNPPGDGDLRVLVFSKTVGYRHASIADGQQMLFALGEEHNFRVDTTEDASVFTQRQLQDYNVVVFLSTTGDILDPAQQQEMQRFIQAGGGFVGIHAATDTEYEWPWYNGLVGAYFASHPNDPNVREADVLVDDRTHVSTEHLPEVWHRNDEWYNYKSIDPDIQVLMRLDESSYEGGTNGEDHPIAWYKEYDGGRAWYTGGGHTAESYREPNFIEHVWGGIQYAAGDRRPVDYSAANVIPEENRFQRTVLASNLNEPMEMDLLPDGRPIFIQRRTGEVIVYDPAFEATAVVGTFDLHTKYEDGLLGLAVDPAFAENNWLYFYYSPAGEESIQRLSRFQFTNNKVRMETEQVILTVPVDRNECCHSGGSLEFGGDGLLYLSVGDNTNPFASEGYSPNDERPDRTNWDAARTSSNTQDLRGKILRIRVNEDGSYDTPADNLFPDPADGRPEIYVMGCRNPFRISIDQHNGNLYWGDVGPDASVDSAGLGPRGHDEVNLATSAGYYGWPFFIADNQAYYEKDFATGEIAAAPFDPAHPINNSPNNTGLRELPPARPAMIYYPYAVSEVFPLMGTGGRNAMAGPVYYEADFRDSETRLPAYYDGKFLFYDWMRDFMMAGTLDENGSVVAMERFLPSVEFSHPIDVVLGPQGDLYVLEYGQLWNQQNPDARLVHLNYLRGNRVPVPALELDKRAGAAPLTITASAENSIDYDGDELSYRWLVDGEGVGEQPTLNHTFDTPGEYELKLELTDAAGKQASYSESILVGNDPPELVVEIDGNRSFYFPGEPLRYAVRVTDREDGSLAAGIDPARVAVSIDYLEGEDPIEINLGHEAMLEQSRFIIGKNLIAQNDCAGCHQPRVASTGPAYAAVASKYAGDRQAEAYLAERIRQGGSGVWGERAMAAHPDLTDSQARQMARYILSLDGAAVTPSLPVADEVRLAPQSGMGKYYLMASYTDAGNAGLPPLTSREVITLRASQQAAADYAKADKVSGIEIPEGVVPGLPGAVRVLVGKGTGWAYYGNIDLQGIRAIGTTVLMSPDYSSGGTIEVVVDDPLRGAVIGSYHLPKIPENFGMNDIQIPIDATPETALRPFYLRFRADGEDPEGTVGALIELRFLRTQKAS